MSAGKSVMNRETIDRLVRQGVLGPLDCHFADFITRLSGGANFELFLAAALVSKHTAEGHVCLDLRRAAGEELLPGAAGAAAVVCPELVLWRRKLEASPAIGSPGEECPLLLDEKSRLYLYRYWEYQRDVAQFIRERSNAEVEGLDLALLTQGLARYFSGGPCTATSVTTRNVIPAKAGIQENTGFRVKPGMTNCTGLLSPCIKGTADWQQIAAFTSVVKKFCVISGGPGTGKTTTVAKVLALLLEQAGDKKPRIALAAPTGKAAARLEEAVVAARKHLDCPETIQEAFPTEASTLHRLLGTIPGSPYFRHDGTRPLAVDAVIVDEASMVDLALLAKLIWALPPHARLILVGDKDQLASVEAGSVLGDICDTGNPHNFSGALSKFPVPGAGNGIATSPENPARPSIQHCIVELRDSYRFGTDSGIGAVSRAIKDGDADRALAILQDGSRTDVGWVELPRPELLPRLLREIVLRGFTNFSDASSLEELFGALQRFRILCALRRGPYGAVAFNNLVERILIEAKRISSGQWYPGRPIMITSNDYELKLFNGDVGVIIADDWLSLRQGRGVTPGTGGKLESALYACFPAREGEFRQFPPARLPEHETVYAMTVHKSQGSEFSEVVLILPDRESPVLTRELLYTGITRAREKVTVWGREEVFRAAVASTVRRSSGLRDALWEA